MIKSNVSQLSDKVSKWQKPSLTERTAAEKEAQPDPDTLRKQASEKGYAEGHAKGLRQAEAETAKTLKTLTALIDAMAQPYQDINQQAMDSIAVLAGRIARCLVKRELKTDPETIMALVRDTVSIMNVSVEKIHIHLNPLDAGLIQNFARTTSEKSRWRIIEDPLITRGDCRVTNRESLVDGNLQSRINTIITQFQGDERV